MNKVIFIFLISSIFIFGACKSDNKKNNNQIDSSSVNNLPSIIKVKDKLFNVPSPLQASEFIRKQNIVFDLDLLNTPENYSKYLTTFKQSLNIGVYGADLGNLFIYEQLSQSSQYLNVIKNLSEQIGILNTLNKKLMTRIENNSDNKDSLIYLISDIYREIDNYLMENDQKDVGVLIIVGGWIESFYYLTTIAQSNKNPELISKIGEQKIPLENIIKLLEPFYNESSTDLDKLNEELVNLSILFDSIEETYTYKTPETFPNKKLTIIHSTTTYNVSDEILTELTKTISKLRKWVIE